MRNCTIRVPKTKALINFAVTAMLICVFVFAYADCSFSHEVAHLFIFFRAGLVLLSGKLICLSVHAYHEKTRFYMVILRGTSVFDRLLCRVHACLGRA